MSISGEQCDSHSIFLWLHICFFLFLFLLKSAFWVSIFSSSSCFKARLCGSNYDSSLHSFYWPPTPTTYSYISENEGNDSQFTSACFGPSFTFKTPPLLFRAPWASWHFSFPFPYFFPRKSLFQLLIYKFQWRLCAHFLASDFMLYWERAWLASDQIFSIQLSPTAVPVSVTAHVYYGTVLSSKAPFLRS